MTAQLIKPLDKGWIIVNEEWTSVISLIAKNTDPEDKKRTKGQLRTNPNCPLKKSQKNNNLREISKNHKNQEAKSAIGQTRTKPL